MSSAKTSNSNVSQSIESVTKFGVQITFKRQQIPIETALSEAFAEIDRKKGAIFSSGFDYPGRHSRWDIAFIDPALEFIAKRNSFKLSALNEQGEGLLEIVHGHLNTIECVIDLHRDSSTLTGQIKRTKTPFTEENRSKQPSVFTVIRALRDLFATDNLEGSHFGLYGAFGYDLVMQFEQIELKQQRLDDIEDCHLFIPLELVVVDRKKEIAERLQYNIKTSRGHTADLRGGGASLAIALGQSSDRIDCDHAPGEFAAKVSRVIEGTKRGDYFEVILSQTFSAPFSEAPSILFGRLCELNPSPYLFLINFGSELLLGSSPEIYIRTTGKRVETCPISGTVARGETALEDADRMRELIMSTKDDSELTMCTDVDRNDLARVCVPGSVRIIGRRQLEFYSHLIHTVDHLEGYLDVGYDSLDAFQMHMWACTVTGAPKPAAIQEIENLEKTPRGWYSGAVGCIGFNGDINTGITLRTAHLKNGLASIRAGATLLYGSDPEQEEQETRTKARAFLVALTSNSNKAKQPSLKFSTDEHPQVSGKRVLLIDYRDSFVHNLAAYLRELGADVQTVRHDFPESIFEEVKPALVLLSPGPFSPQHFNIPNLVKKLVAKQIPLFGVCLGHQGIGEAFGATLAQLPTPVHGKPAVISHTGTSIFEGVENHFDVGRYHSLYLVEDSIPKELEVIARTTAAESADTTNGVVMAICHRTLPIAGVQFHPESLMTLKKNSGHQLLRNVLRQIASSEI